MEEKKSVADKLRESAKQEHPSICAMMLKALWNTHACPRGTCVDCRRKMLNTLADMIEAEQTVDVSALNILCEKMEVGGEKSRDIAMQIRAALNGAERSKTEHDGVDVDALLKLADHFERIGNEVMIARLVEPAEYHKWKARIRDAVKGANASKSMPLPEGIEWPRFEDGELVKVGDMFKPWGSDAAPVFKITFNAVDGWNIYDSFGRFIITDGKPIKRPEPEVLDTDGVPIKVGDTVWHEVDGSELTVVGFRNEKEDDEVMVDVEGKWFCVRQYSLTHRKPDTAESLLREFIDAANSDDSPDLTPIIERSLKLLGGE